MEAYPEPFLGLLPLCMNSNLSSQFHVNKANHFKGERDNLTLVLKKIDREQPHPSGTSRLAAFQEYIHELDIKHTYHEYWANKLYYRDVVMNELKRNSPISEAGSVSDSISVVTTIVSFLG